MEFTPILRPGDATCCLRWPRAKLRLKRKRKATNGNGTRRHRTKTISPGHMEPSAWVRELGDPFAALAAAVIFTAIDDLKHGRTDDGIDPSEVPLRGFFYCEGFQVLADGLGWDAEYFHRLLNSKFGAHEHGVYERP